MEGQGYSGPSSFPARVNLLRENFLRFPEESKNIRNPVLGLILSQFERSSGRGPIHGKNTLRTGEGAQGSDNAEFLCCNLLTSPLSGREQGHMLITLLSESLLHQLKGPSLD